LLRRHLNKIVRDDGGDLVPLPCPCQIRNLVRHGELGSAVPKTRSWAGEILLEEENGSWPAVGIGYSPVPESWEREHEMGIPDAYTRLANESRSDDLDHDRHGRDGECSMSPCSGIVAALCCCRLLEDNPRGGKDVAQETRPREAPDQVPLCVRLFWLDGSVSMGSEWC
jgi:hypothetical protein